MMMAVAFRRFRRGNLSGPDNGPHPPFLFCLAKRETGRARSKEKTALLRSGAVALRADGGLPSWCRPDSSAFCRLAPGYVFASALTRVSGAAENRGGHRMVPAPEPAAAPWSREGPFQRADTQVRPYGRTRNRHRLVGTDLCVSPSPAREGQRQRLRSRLRLCRLTDAAYPLRVKEKRTVSPTSPGLDDPKGSAFPSLTAARERQPSPAGGRRSALARTDPPKHFFSSTGRGAFSF